MALKRFDPGTLYFMADASGAAIHITSHDDETTLTAWCGEQGLLEGPDKAYTPKGAPTLSQCCAECAIRALADGKYE